MHTYLKSFAIAAVLVTPICAVSIPAVAATEPTATTAEIPAVKLALIKRLDQAMDFDSLMKQMFEQMAPALTQSVRQATPKMNDEQAKAFAGVMSTVMTKYTVQMKAKMFDAYARVYSEDELRSMVEFYESPNGQSILKKMPQVMAEYMPSVQAMMPAMMADFQQGFKDAGLLPTK